MLKSSICTYDQLSSPTFKRWAERMKLPFRPHRKLWEFCYIAQALFERGKLAPGMRGLGFAVGREPLPALFASLGCTIVATDLDPCTGDGATAALWSETNQHASSVDVLNEEGICPPDVFTDRVSFRYADMNNVPADLTGFDFIWSSCAVEHVGTLDLSKRAVLAMMNCLKPGGVAVHTTEFNVSSNDDTLMVGDYVIWRDRDLKEESLALQQAGHRVASFNLASGRHEADIHVDEPPYPQECHLKLKLGSYVATSVGMIIEANSALKPSLWGRLLGRRAAPVRQLASA